MFRQLATLTATTCAPGELVRLKVRLAISPQLPDFEPCPQQSLLTC